jgi:hypothetical protein
MYGIEPLFIDQESVLDSEIQMTPYDASLYESIAGSHGTNVTKKKIPICGIVYPPATKLSVIPK